MEDILVLGVGNALRGDDGVGVRVIEYLRDHELPPQVEVVDGGTTTLDWLDAMAGRQKVIIVDAVQGGGEAGAVYCFTPAEVAAETHSITSIHQIGVSETLALAQQLGCGPQDVVIFGVEPKGIGWGAELSPEVAAVVPQVADLVLDEIRRSILIGESG